MSKFSGTSGYMWRCEECLYESQYKTNVKEHVESQHLKGQQYLCTYCDKIYPNKKSLRNHTYAKHRTY